MLLRLCHGSHQNPLKHFDDVTALARWWTRGIKYQGIAQV